MRLLRGVDLRGRQFGEKLTSGERIQESAAAGVFRG
jgi:hypothetical protein